MIETRCDFCGRRFTALAWNEATCHRCEQDGWPNQSKTDFRTYQRLLYRRLREAGKRKPVNRSAAAIEISPLAGRISIETASDAKNGLRVNPAVSDEWGPYSAKRMSRR